MITRILAAILNMIVVKIVSHNQFGFLRDRRTHDCISLASETFNCLDSSNAGHNLAIQIDIKKAFYTMNWRFIIKVLKGFGVLTLFEF